MGQQKTDNDIEKLYNHTDSISFCLIVNGQTITERLILTYTKDSLYLNSDKISLDKQENYCFVVEIGELVYFLTNKDTIGGF